MVTLYKKDSKGKTRVWSMWVDGINNSINSEAGEVGGAMTPTCTIIHKGLGRKSPYEQAVADMQTEVNKKTRAGYVDNVNNLRESGFTETIGKPSKGNVYHATGANAGVTLVKAKLAGKLIGMGTKLDGWRYRIWTDGIECIFYSSSGKIVLGFPQVEKEILELFPAFAHEFRVTEIILDGEMYNHEEGGQNSAAACGTGYQTPLRDKMEFHIYDFVDYNATYLTRYQFIEHFWVGKSVIPWKMILFRADDGQIAEQFELYLSNGYEGAIIRNLEGRYEHKKNNQFLKYKPLLDEEVIVVGFNKSITGETLGSLQCKRPGTDVQFSTDLKGAIGSDDVKKFIWDNQAEHLGKWVTIEYLNLTDDGSPRHPRAKCFRKGNSID